MNEWLLHLGLCPFKNILGIPCPACGMTRAFLSFFKLDLQSALNFHPLFWLVPLIFAVVLFRKRVPLFLEFYKSKWFSLSLISLFAVVYVWRLALLFPTEIPMDFNKYALLPSLIRWLF